MQTVDPAQLRIRKYQEISAVLPPQLTDKQLRIQKVCASSLTDLTLIKMEVARNYIAKATLIKNKKDLSQDNHEVSCCYVDKEAKKPIPVEARGRCEHGRLISHKCSYSHTDGQLFYKWQYNSMVSMHLLSVTETMFHTICEI